MADDSMEPAIELIQAGKIEAARERLDVQYKLTPGVGHAVTQEGVNLTMDLFRETIGK